MMIDKGLNLTEAEWLTCAQPYPMFDYLRARVVGKTDERRMRLFDCACAREIWHLLTDAISREAVEISERYADQQATFAELDSIHQKAFAVARSQRKDPFNDAGWAACSCSISRSALSSAYDKASWALAKELSKKAPVREAHRAVTSARQTRLVRCIFGNPYRLAELEPALMTPAIIALARTAYDERLLPGFDLKPGNLASLADALEGVGANPEVVRHLREPGPHARGCWAVDAVLGRQCYMPQTAKPEPIAAVVVAPVANEHAPCTVWKNDDGTHILGFSDFGPTAAIFEELGYEGGGYDWHGVVDALVRMKAPKIRRKLDYDPEGSMFTALSKDHAAIKQVADLIRAVVEDPVLLRKAISKADPDLIGG